jgi:hypothetical protein
MLAELAPDSKKPQTIAEVGRLATFSQLESHHLLPHERLKHLGLDYEVVYTSEDGKVILIERSANGERMGVAEADLSYIEHKLEEPDSGWQRAA